MKDKNSRREFISGIWQKILFAGFFPAASGILVKKSIRGYKNDYIERPMPFYSPAKLRMPGAENREEFLRKCIHCFLCGEVCPRHAVWFYGMDAGILSGTPYILPASRGCDLCMMCVKVCPTGAIRNIKPEKVNMGKARINENICLPYIDRGYCGACITICPVRAVEEGFKLRPKLIDEKCVGCGICEEICPVDAKAIRVIPA